MADREAPVSKAGTWGFESLRACHQEVKSLSELPVLSDDERRDLTDPRSEFTAEDRVFFAMTYIHAGENSALTAARIGKILGREMDGSTLRQWKRRPWWPVAIDAAKKYLQQELDTRYTALIHLTEKEMVDRVKNGDSRLTKDGELVKVPVTLRDLVGAHAIIAEQRARIRGTGQKEASATGLDLAMKLADMLQKQGERTIKNAIPGEYEDVSEEEHSGEIGEGARRLLQGGGRPGEPI